MAGPSFYTPKPVSPSRPGKRFTLAEANRTLPLVQRIVGDIVKTHEQVKALQDGASATRNKENAAAQQRQYEQAIERLQTLVDELHGVGCELKDSQNGLVDFIGRHQGRDVCLCWKLGEENIGFWHELQTGFAGRQPVASLQETK